MRGLLYPTSKILAQYPPNPYLLRIRNEFPKSFYDEEEAKKIKGLWRKNVFKATPEIPLDLEIGTGNGFFFAHHAFQNPQRCSIGIEIKYRPIYQTLRRHQALGCNNSAMIRMHALQVGETFEDQEIDNVYIHFPDPWPKKKHHKNRLIQMDFMRTLYDVQKPDRFVEFKTDNLEYFEWALERFQKSPYRIERLTYDLHQSEWAGENFQTHFEKLWVSKGFKILYVRLKK